MISIASLWLPILLAAVAVFAVSSIMHMFLGYHWNDLRRLPQQDALLDAVGAEHVEAEGAQVVHAHRVDHAIASCFKRVWVAVEDAERLAVIMDGLEQVLAEVRSCVQDWRPMVRRVNDVIQDLKSNPPPVTVAETYEPITTLSLSGGSVRAR